MTDPGTTRPFAPAELDAIEDALERLTSASELADEDALIVRELPDGGDAIVRERLASYRAISRLSRDVRRSYEAPTHVLERVVSLARESAVNTQAPTAAAAPPRASLWQRMRGAWTVPLFATAAAAGIVAIIVVPQQASDRAVDVVAANEPAAPPPAQAAAQAKAESAPMQGADGRLAMADPAAEETATLERLRGGAVLDENQASEQDEKLGEGRFATDSRRQSELGDKSESRRDNAKDATTSTPTDSIAAGPKNAPKSPKPASKPKSDDAPSATKGTGSGGAPGGAPPATTTPTKNEELEEQTDELARADALRRSGDCNGAVKLYESVRKSGVRKQRAKALVGLALCAERKGESDRAADLLAKARADDAEIDAYYDSER